MPYLLVSVPDTLSGALVLSIIDFCLSIVIIVGISYVLSVLPLIDRIASRKTRAASIGDKETVEPPAAEKIVS